VADLLMLCPSRGRPESINDPDTGLRSIWGSVTTDADLLVAVDEDDPKVAEYGTDVQVMPGKTTGLAPILNTLAAQFVSQYDYIGFLGDDHRPRTVGWDRMLIAELGGKPGVAYGDDLFQGKKAATAVVISSPILAALGYMVPPGVIHLYMDIFWIQLGMDLGNVRYCPWVVMEHMHPSAGKGKWDDGYARDNSIVAYSRDEWAYEAYLKSLWPSELARIRGILGG